MKKLLIALVILALLVVGLFVFALMNANSIVAKLKPTLEQSASDALGAHVSIGKIDVSIFPSTSLMVNSFRVAPDERSKEALTLDNLTLRASLMPLLTGSLVINELSLDSPSITIVKDQSGVYPEGLPRKTGASKKAKTPAKKKEPAEGSAKSSGASTPPPVELHLQRFELRNATLIYKDTTLGTQHAVKKVNVSSGLDFENGVVSLQQIVASAQIDGKGEVQINGDGLRYTLASGKAELLKITTAALGHSITAHGDFNTNTFAGNLTLSNGQLVLGPETLALGANASLTRGRAKLTELSVNGLGGKIAADGEIGLEGKQDLAGSLLVTDIDLKRSLLALKPDLPVFLTGTLQKADGSITGLLGDKLIPSLVGKSSISIKKAELKGTNLAGEVLQAIKDVPFLSDSLYSSVPAEQRTELESDNTEIESLTATVQIGNQSLRTNDLLLVSTIFDLSARGKIGFDTSLNLDAKIRFTELFSRALASKIRELENWLDRDNRLTIPLQIRGTATSVTVLPDISELLATGAGKMLTDKLLGKVLGGKKDKEKGGSKSGDAVKDLGGLLGF